MKKQITINPNIIAKKTGDRNRERFHNLANTLVYQTQGNISASAVECIAFNIDEILPLKKFSKNAGYIKANVI